MSTAKRFNKPIQFLQDLSITGTGTNATMSSLRATNVSVTNVTVSSILGNNLALTNVTGTNMIFTNATVSSILGTNLSGTNATIASILGTNLLSTNITANSVLLTNIVGTNMTVSSVIGSNLSITNVTVGVLSATGNSNTIGSIVTTGGNVGIGVNPSYTLHVSGDIFATGDVTAFSDRRLKTDIEPVTGALEKTHQLRGVYYTHNNHRGVGLIAQEVQDILPEVVATKGEYLGIAYGNISGLLIEAIKELNTKFMNEVSELKRANEELKQQLLQLSNK
jgi:hypothetical protein